MKTLIYMSAAASAPTFNTNGGLFTSSAAPQPPPSGSIPPPPAHSATNLASPRAGRRIVSVAVSSLHASEQPSQRHDVLP